MAQSREDVDREVNRFAVALANHTPSQEGIQDIRTIRRAAKRLGIDIIELSEPSRERSLALTKLEEAVHWATKAIALQTGAPTDPPELDQ